MILLKQLKNRIFYLEIKCNFIRGSFISQSLKCLIFRKIHHFRCEFFGIKGMINEVINVCFYFFLGPWLLIGLSCLHDIIDVSIIIIKLWLLLLNRLLLFLLLRAALHLILNILIAFRLKKQAISCLIK